MWQAEKDLRALGSEGASGLLEIRRNGPGTLRRHALHALAMIGAGDELNDRDRRALERLVRIKLLNDRPLDYHSATCRISRSNDRWHDATRLNGPGVLA